MEVSFIARLCPCLFRCGEFCEYSHFVRCDGAFGLDEAFKDVIDTLFGDAGAAMAAPTTDNSFMHLCQLIHGI